MTENEEEMKNTEEENEDDIEPLLRGLLENRHAFESLMNMLTKLNNSGLMSVVENISADYLPSDIEFLSEFLTSKDFLTSFVKTMNVVTALSHSLAGERASDALKAILYNSDAIWEGMVTGAKNPEAISILRLYAMLRDPDTAAGLTAVLNALKAVGMALRKVPDE
ncbi:MAG: DUF1641 domain-containing protein [Thermoplasmataceae archaeon]